MDTRDGRIVEVAGDKPLSPFLIPMSVKPTQLQRSRMRVGRNDLCPCGSGKKFKRCHLIRKR